MWVSQRRAPPVVVAVSRAIVGAPFAELGAHQFADLGLPAAGGDPPRVLLAIRAGLHGRVGDELAGLRIGRRDFEIRLDGRGRDRHHCNVENQNELRHAEQTEQDARPRWSKGLQ